jgi:acetolactate synthase-1/2/3 large subunit
VDTEQGFLPKLASRKNEDGSMTSPELEDMAPFLSRDELRLNMLP